MSESSLPSKFELVLGMAKSLWKIFVGMVLGGAAIMTWVYKVDSADAARKQEIQQVVLRVNDYERQFHEFQVDIKGELGEINGKMDLLIKLNRKRDEK